MFVRFTSRPNLLFDEFQRLHQAMEDAFANDPGTGIRSLPRGSFPPINVVQTADDVQVYAYAPGVDPKTLDVTLQQGLLRISGRRAIARDQQAVYYRQERFEGDFGRSISLGDDLDTQRVEASYRDGILKITLHRREATKPRQIQIQ